VQRNSSARRDVRRRRCPVQRHCDDIAGRREASTRRSDRRQDPEIDRVAVRVVVDSYQFAVAPSRKVANVDIEHFGWGIGGGKPPGKTLISEFGLSTHVESRRGTETRNVLMDFGFTPDALVNNADVVGIDPAALDALVLSIMIILAVSPAS
jgi:hypothetical protein